MRANKERKFQLPDEMGGLPKSRLQKKKYHMYLMTNLNASNNGVNETRETQFYNYCEQLGPESYPCPKLWIVPCDMMTSNAILVRHLTKAINDQTHDRSLKREMENIRDSRFSQFGTGLTARILLAMVYHSLQRASSSIANLTNKQHFLSIH